MVTLLLPLAVNAFAAETKDIRFNFKNAEPVIFSHDVHLRKYNNNCRMCHDTLFNLRDRRHYTMVEMEKTRSCGACHSGIKAFSVAADKDCVLCHKGKPRDVAFKVKGAGDVTFNHSVHIAKTGGTCKGCHNGKVITGREKPVTMAEMEKGRTCGVCHNAKIAFPVSANCDRCHKGMKPKNITFNLKWFAPAVFSHSSHLLPYQCADCHTKLFPYKIVIGKATMNDMEKGTSCGACHNGKVAFASSGDCNKCHRGLNPGRVTFKTEAGEAAFSHDIHVKAYACAECHTKIFPYKAISLNTTMANMEKGNSCGACHNKGKDAFPVQGDCEKCHKM